MPVTRNRLRLRARRHRASAGQSLAEFAVVLPVLVLVFGAVVDLSRVYEVLLKLESATRDAAEFAAMNAMSSAEATTIARGVVCTQFDQAATCTDPSVSTSYSSTTTSGGGTAANPAVTVTVSSTTTFATLLPYPFVSGGSVGLSASTTYTVLQGR